MVNKTQIKKERMLHQKEIKAFRIVTTNRLIKVTSVNPIEKSVSVLTSEQRTSGSVGFADKRIDV